MVRLELREAIRALPGMDRLLPALEGLPPSFLVGGAVRDLLRGVPVVDLDVAVEGDAVATAAELAMRLRGEARPHGRFGTAMVRADGLALDLAGTRRERYASPGALPEVEPALLEEDLGRRDFTVNAMAAGLRGEDLGRLYDPHGGQADLRARLIRVLHPGSFRDDPTRLLRALRYEVRIGGRMEASTEKAALEALGAGAMRTVSGPRVRDGLFDLLAETEAPRAVDRFGELGVDRALHSSLRADAELVASAQLGSSETRADRVLAALAALVSVAPRELGAWVDELQLERQQRDRVLFAAQRGPMLASELRRPLRPSEVRTLLDAEPAESLALALACAAPPEPVLRYVSQLRLVRLEITGDDLLSAGAPQSAALGRALEETLRRKLDGEVAGRDEELRVALALAQEDA